VTGNDISHVTRSDVSNGSDLMRTGNRFSRFFLTIVVVQNVPLRMTDMATGNDVTEGYVTQKGFPWKSARMCNRKLRNIRPSGAFSPEMTSSNITRRASPGTGNHASYDLIIFYSFRWLSASFPPFYFQAERLRIFGYVRGCCVVLQVVNHVRVLTVVFLLNNIRVK
jgi:hypothetical protein